MKEQTYTVVKHFKLDDNGNEKADGYMLCKNGEPCDWFALRRDAVKAAKELEKSE